MHSVTNAKLLCVLEAVCEEDKLYSKNVQEYGFEVDLGHCFPVNIFAFASLTTLLHPFSF